MRLKTAALTVLVCAVVSPPLLAERPRVYALTGGTVVSSPGESIEGGVVVLRDGLIDAVGSGVDVPPDAVVIDVAGKWVYAGLIDPDIPDGAFMERDSGRSEGSGPGGDSRNAPSPAGASHPISRVHPERDARDRLVPFEGDRKRVSERYRALGYTAVLVAPDDGILRGSSVAILLQDDVPVSGMILRDDVAQHVGFDRGRFGEGYPTSLMGAAAAFRQTLLDAERYAVWTERYETDPRGLRRPEVVLAFDSLSSALDGTQAVVFALESNGDFALADSLAREFELDAVISASGTEWEIADRVAESGRVVILPLSYPDKPKLKDADETLDVSLREMRRYLEAPAAAAVLHEAGVELAFTTRGLKNLADFPRNLQKVVEAGLPEEVALAALTTVPAALLGVDAAVGTLEAGKIANVIVTDGPLFAKDTRPRYVFVDGVEYRIEEKKKPKGDPGAVIDPRGTWSVVFELDGRTIQREWTIEGGTGEYTGTAETRSGIVSFDRIDVEGNAMTLIFPARDGYGSTEITVIVTGDRFEGIAELGSRSVPISGTRTLGPEGGGR